MQIKERGIFTKIHTDGSILPGDLLQRISENDKDIKGLEPTNYHLYPGEKLVDFELIKLDKL